MQVIAEDMVLEDGKFYPIMKLVWGADSYRSELEYQYGKILLGDKHPVLKAFLEKEFLLYQEIMGKLELQLQHKVTGPVLNRQLEVKRELEQIGQALNQYL